jgi:hypothetical protein
MPIPTRDIVDLFVQKMRLALQEGGYGPEFYTYMEAARTLLQILSTEDKQMWFTDGRFPAAEMAYTYFYTKPTYWKDLRGGPAREFPWMGD